jgi:hypothetical protein
VAWERPSTTPPTLTIPEILKPPIFQREGGRNRNGPRSDAIGARPGDLWPAPGNADPHAQSELARSF